jgi:hypothetical protein
VLAQQVERLLQGDRRCLPKARKPGRSVPTRNLADSVPPLPGSGQPGRTQGSRGGLEEQGAMQRHLGSCPSPNALCGAFWIFAADYHLAAVLSVEVEVHVLRGLVMYHCARLCGRPSKCSDFKVFRFPTP